MKELDEREIAKIKEHYDYFDEDSSGQMDLKEFRKLFKVIAPDAGRDEADAGFDGRP